MNPIHSSIRRVVVPALAALAVGIGGCAGFSQPRLSSSGVKCKEPPISTNRTPTVAVLTQLGMNPTEAAQGQQVMSVILRGATAVKAHLLLNGFGSGVADPNLVVNTSLAGLGPNELFQSSDLDCKTQAVLSGYHSLSTTTPEAGKLDVFDALRTLKDDLTGVPHGETDVVVVGSLLNNVNVDLTKPSVLDNPAATINALARLGLNFRCTGWRVYAIGGGLHNGVLISSPEDSALTRFYATYFAHCGGALVLWDDTGLSQFPVDSGAIHVADYSTLPIPVERRRGVIVAQLSSDVLFELDSARLQPSAGPELRQLLPLLTHAKAPIQVNGYTDSLGSQAINRPLSWARAMTVARWIEHQTGITGSRIHTEGFGEADPSAPNGPHGQPLNRRVTVTIHVR
jgi:outer membrane protein OmpA-like peptidoglycan-associated protein